MSTSNDPIIQLDSVGKCYRIYENPQDRFKQALLNRLPRFLKRLSARPLYREHWALKDINFELHPGEAAGIIGRNGAGKSTLLQVIAGTLKPTEGKVTTNGRITALLELGSGFSGDFTGRENVFMNGQIIGLSQEEILDKFDDIASFADIGDFIDQPVKTYSSGMMMRLAFAVQTAVEPKILIVDEALAVGDMFFQAKCMSRLNQLVDSGVALLFVSHDVGVVRQLCGKAILLEKGLVEAMGSAGFVADQYVKLQLEERNQSASVRKDSEDKDNPLKEEPQQITTEEYEESQEESGNKDVPPVDILLGQDAFKRRAQHNRVSNGQAEILNVQLMRDGQICDSFEYDDKVGIKIVVEFNQEITNLNLAVKIRTLQGVDVVYLDGRIHAAYNEVFQTNCICLFNYEFQLPLMHGKYELTVHMSIPPQQDEDGWTYIDMINHAAHFFVGPKEGGMLGGLIALPAKMSYELNCNQNGESS